MVFTWAEGAAALIAIGVVLYVLGVLVDRRP